MKYKLIIAIIAIFFFPIHLLAQTEEKDFLDVMADSNFFIPIRYLKEKGLVAGYSDGTFHPERPVSRAEALAMILRLRERELNEKTNFEKSVDPENPIEIQLPKATTVTLHNLITGEKTTLADIKELRVTSESGKAKVSVLKKSAKKPFRDVSGSDWFFETVREGKRLGLVKGYRKGKYFRPNNPVNLAEALRILFQSENIETGLTAADVPAGIPHDAWYAKDFAYASNRTILTQREHGGVFPADEKLNRGELTLLLYRFLKTHDNASFGYASWYGDGLAKTKLTSGNEFAERNLTAAHRTLPFGTILHVTNMTNGKSVSVVVNDRGPYVLGRIVDLSKSAFAMLESPSVGIISVQIEY